MGIINIKDLPDSLMELLKQRFEADPAVQNLRIQMNLLARKGHFEKAIELGEEINTLFAEAVRKYIHDAQIQQAKFDTELMDIPREDKDEMMQLLMVLFMACDIIESAVIDVNDVLHRTKPDLNIVTFNDIKQAMEMAREKLKYLQKNSNYMNDLTWGEQCDNMYLLMQNKAKSIIRKEKNNKDWGKNTERFKL